MSMRAQPRASNNANNGQNRTGKPSQEVTRICAVTSHSLKNSLTEIKTVSIRFEVSNPYYIRKLYTLRCTIFQMEILIHLASINTYLQTWLPVWVSDPRSLVHDVVSPNGEGVSASYQPQHRSQPECLHLEAKHKVIDNY